MGPSIMGLDTGVSVLLSPGGGVIKCECVINALCLSDLRFSLVCVQKETWGHYSCGCLDKRLNVSVYRSESGECASAGILAYVKALYTTCRALCSSILSQQLVPSIDFAI